ncbi:MAG TPA: hypothetical protein VKN18_08255 [Blastocatellia bacterium]|nr:hypothetical protein [Blastocatellia bacterium]
MPKLLFFVACERVIVSREGPISLITLLEGLTTSLPSDTYDKLPDDAIAPIIWHVVTKWSREEIQNEEPARWQQRITVSAHDGRVATDATTEFELATSLAMRNIVQVNGLPIKPVGHDKITLFLRKADDTDSYWQEIATYILKVENIPPPADQPA